MQYCNHCNGLLVKNGSKIVCNSCAKEHLEEFDLSSKEKFVQKEEISIIEEKDSIVLPKISHICERCGNNESYFWHGNYIGDEADTLFYKCTKCGITTQHGGQRGGR